MSINIQDVPVFDRSQLGTFISECLEDDIVPMVWGPSGCGKSQTVAWFAEANGYQLEHLHWGNYATHSAGGVVVPNMQTFDAVFTRPDYMARLAARAAESDKPIILLLDEMPNAPKDVTAVANQLVDENRVGQYDLPDNCHVVALGNGPLHGAHVCNMAGTTANRMAHGTYNGATVAEFIQFGEDTGRLSVEVMSFLAKFPGALYDFDKTRVINNTHRSWEMASRALDRRRASGMTVMSADFLAHLSTRIMRKYATEMAVFISMADKLTSMADIERDPDTALLPQDRDISASDMISANFMQMRMCSQALGTDKRQAQAIAAYIGRMSSEIRAAFLSIVMRAFNEKRINIGVVQVFQQAFKAEFIAVIDKASGR